MTLFEDEMAGNCQGLVGPFSPGMNVAVSCRELMGPFFPGMDVNETISSGSTMLWCSCVLPVGLYMHPVLVLIVIRNGLVSGGMLLT